MKMISIRPSGRELWNASDEVSRLLNLSGFPRFEALGAGLAPAVDLEESSDEFVLRVDLPGFSQKDVKVQLVGDTLTISGERRREAESKSGVVLRQERAFGTFERSFTLGAPVRSDLTRASYKDGVLEVHVPKSEDARMREIEVQVG